MVIELEVALTIDILWSSPFELLPLAHASVFHHVFVHDGVRLWWEVGVLPVLSCVDHSLVVDWLQSSAVEVELLDRSFGILIHVEVTKRDFLLRQRDD